MKQGTNFILPITFDFDLNLVESIDFVFRQSRNPKGQFSGAGILDGIHKEFTYPSDVALLSTTESNTIDLYWADVDTYKFNPEEYIYLDSKIHLKDSNVNPETEIIKIKMSPTLFKKEGNKIL